jgi:tRNA(adenine34) deaminase
VYDVVRDRRLPYRAEVVAGVGQDEASALLRAFFDARR